jgi:hypothetical protein
MANTIIVRSVLTDRSSLTLSRKKPIAQLLRGAG